MKLYAFDIPDATDDLAGWLEQQLVGLRLGEVIAELAAVHRGQHLEAMTLDQLLAGYKTAVLERGLASLQLAQLQGLLRHPQLLLDLQELVLSEGGEFWQELTAQNEDSTTAAQRGKSRVIPQPPAAPVQPRGGAWFSHPLVVCLTTAASLLAALWVVDALPRSQPTTAPTPVAWGWSKPGAMPEQASRDEYLSGLATAADEWFKKTPSDPQELATRISQFRAGCSTLILAEHRPLSKEDRQWLVDKCRAWATKIDGHLAALESGTSTTDVRTAMDDTVRKLSTALRERASQPVG
jgi:hypothetical protein